MAQRASAKARIDKVTTLNSAPATSGTLAERAEAERQRIKAESAASVAKMTESFRVDCAGYASKILQTPILPSDLKPVIWSTNVSVITFEFMVDGISFHVRQPGMYYERLVQKDERGHWERPIRSLADVR